MFSFFEANHCLPLFHMAKSFSSLEETEETYGRIFDWIYDVPKIEYSQGIQITG